MIKRLVAVACLIVMVFGFSSLSQAQLFVGTGAKFQSDVPYLMMVLAVNQSVAELAWGMKHHQVSEPNFRADTETRIFLPVVTLTLDLDFPVKPFISLGGISISTEALGAFKGQPFHLLFRKEGAQAGAGLSYTMPDYPITLSGSVNYSTIEPIMPISLIINDKVETMPMPLPGFSGWGWNLSARTIFELEPLLENFFDAVVNGFRSNNDEADEE